MYLCRSVFESVSSELLTKTGSLRRNGDFHLILMQRSIFLCNFLQILNISRRAGREEYNTYHGSIPRNYLLWRITKKKYDGVKRYSI